MTKSYRRLPFGYRGTELTTRHIGDVLPAFLSSVHEKHEERHDLILAAWPQLVGPKIAQYTSSESFNDGILKVRVKNSTLLSLLKQSEKPKLIAALRKKFPKVYIEDIRFRMG